MLINFVFVGLEDLLIELGWKNMGASWANIHAAAVLMCTGAEGPYSHVALGVGKELTNAHNMAHYRKPPSVYIKVDSVYVMPFASTCRTIPLLVCKLHGLNNASPTSK